MNKEELIGKLHMIYAGDRNALEEMVGYYDGLKQGIEIVQQENKELKEQLLVTQTNEETFRLEMKDITQTLGLDEDTIFDDVKAFARSLEVENQKLQTEKEQLNSLVNSCQEEIKQLKKQLEERPKEYVFIGNAQNKTRDFINQITKDNKEFKNQQKEFINYLEDEIKFYKNRDSYMVEHIHGSYDLTQIELNILKEILQKYKSIIGDDK